MINAKTTIVKPLPIAKLNQFTDRVVYHTADITLQRTEPHIPVRSKHMYNDIYARGVRGQNKTYTLGVEETPYAQYVWKMPQSTHWTNKKSYAEWFITEFRNSQEKIASMAVNRAMKVIK